MSREIKFKGNPVTLVGRNTKIASPAADFRVVTQDLKEVGLADYAGKFKVITSFPSLDTPVCDLQVKEFNQRATNLGSDILVLGISKDLPFAQKRFCDTFAIKNIALLSDYKFSSFGINYGLLIKESNLLARAVVILDKNNILRYRQVVTEQSQPPDYQDVLKNLGEVIKTPLEIKSQDLPAHCKPCEGAVAALPKEKIERLLAQHRGWELLEDKKIEKTFQFKDFVEAKYFLDLIAVIAEEQGHHPSFRLNYNKLKITLTTHAAAGLTDNDFIMARIIDEL